MTAAKQGTDLPPGCYVVFWDPYDVVVPHVTPLTPKYMYDFDPHAIGGNKLEAFGLGHATQNSYYKPRSAWVVRLNISKKQQDSFEEYLADVKEAKGEYWALFNNCTSAVAFWLRKEFGNPDADVLFQMQTVTPWSLLETITRLRQAIDPSYFRWSGFVGDPNFGDPQMVSPDVMCRTVVVYATWTNYRNIRSLILSQCKGKEILIDKPGALRGAPKT